MSKYNDELVSVYVEREMGQFIKEHMAVIDCTVGESILIMSATSDYANDLLQGLTEKWQRSLVVESTVEHTKKLMLEKRGIKYGENEKSKETKNGEANAVRRRRAR